MPNNIIKSFAKKSGKSKKDVEKLWDKAKKLTTKEYPKIEPESERYYKVVTGMLKKMLNLYDVNEATTTSDVPNVPGTISTVMGRQCFSVSDECFWHLHNEIRNKGQWRKKFFKDTEVVNHVINKPTESFYIKHGSMGLVRKIKM